jgi:ABC-type transporter lipoprotein component MlaA
VTARLVRFVHISACMLLQRFVPALCVLALGCAHLGDQEQTSASLGSVAMVGFDEFETPTTREQYEVLRYVRDPIEPANRGFFAVTRVAMQRVVRPVAIGWRYVFPRPVRAGIDNFAYNLGYPDRVVSLLLQGEWRHAGTETGHFLVNSTAGVGGFVDVSRRLGIPTRAEDVGQAFGRWGIGPGFYLFIPLLGPSSGRDGVGRIFDAALTPSTYLPGAGVVLALNSYSSRIPTLDTLSDRTADVYPAVKTFWAIQRDVQVTDYQIPESTWERADPNPSLGVFYTRLADPQFALDAARGEVPALEGREPLPYSLWLQEQPAPLLFVIPGIGAHRTATSAVQIAENAFARGYSVAILSSPFHPEFILSGLTALYPGYTPSDARDLHRAMRAVRGDVEAKQPGAVTSVSLVGYSLGATEAVFISELDREMPAAERLDFQRVVAINPAARLEHAAREFDRYFQTPAQWPEPSRDRRVIDVAKRAYLVANELDEEELGRRRTLPFDRAESDFLIGMVGRATALGAIEASRQRGGDGLPARGLREIRRDPSGPVSEELEASSLERYVEELALPYVAKNLERGRSPRELQRAADLRSQEELLRDDPRVRVLTNQDDFILSRDDLAWLERVLGERLTLHPGGGHLGNLHTDEVQGEIMDALAVPQPEVAGR